MPLGQEGPYEAYLPEARPTPAKWKGDAAKAGLPAWDGRLAAGTVLAELWVGRMADLVSSFPRLSRGPAKEPVRAARDPDTCSGEP